MLVVIAALLAFIPVFFIGLGLGLLAYGAPRTHPQAGAFILCGGIWLALL